MDGSLLNQGLTLMLAGMGTVFVFLSLLVAAMTAMSKVAGRFEPAAAPSASSGPSEEEVAAISVAIKMHRKR